MTRITVLLQIVLFALAAPASWAQTTSGKWKLIGWNDLGMHCMDGKDYSVYSILPPYNTFHAHLLDGSGKLVRSPNGVTLSYEAVADPDGSFNSTSSRKTNFWQYAPALFGVNLAAEMGLVGFAMPGNQRRAMRFDTAQSWFTGEGVPITPWDDRGNKNYYPLMRLRARNAQGQTLATADVVLPVSDELDCRVCHASGSNSGARPSSGWTFFAGDAEKDYKFNVLKLHDERSAASTVFRAALATSGYNAAGLLATAQGGKPVLCAGCHASNALGTRGATGVAPLTTSVHAGHARVLDPTNNLMLDAVDNRSACYRCHPGSETRCLRGAMGNALNPDGTMAMQCQSCHGGMSAVGAAGRNGWFDEPTCQNCHTGTAVRNNGQIRYTSAFDASGRLRTAVDLTFATNPNTPAAGVSLYRFSKGHGGLQCEACHGSTHAEYPSSHRNDNLMVRALQGHDGTLVECTACHASEPRTVNGGPHGMHPVSARWVDSHGDTAERGAAQCQVCHGTNYRGTVLSRTKAARSFRTEHGTKTLAAGAIVGCYNCHNGPRGD